jgi:predicted NUDIX family NTP pyrophosphohydrolase
VVARPPRLKGKAQVAVAEHMNDDRSRLLNLRQRGGKRVIAFCRETDFDTALLSSNTVKMEWPPKSGKLLAFPEVDRAEWCDLGLRPN